MIFSILLLVLGMTLIPLIRLAGIWIVLVTHVILRSGVVASANALIFKIKGLRGVGETYGGMSIGLKNTLDMLGALVSPPIGNSFSSLMLTCPFFRQF